VGTEEKSNEQLKAKKNIRQGKGEGLRGKTLSTGKVKSEKRD